MAYKRGNPRSGLRGASNTKIRHAAHSQKLQSNNGQMSGSPRKARELSTAYASKDQLDGRAVRHGQSRTSAKSSTHDAVSANHRANATRLDAAKLDRVRKKRKRKRILIGVLCGLLTLCLGCFAFAVVYINNINSNLKQGVGADLLSALMPTDTPTDPFYVLLLGTDGSAERTAEGDGDAFRSDSMMLARIDPKDKKCAIVSIPRDTLIELEGHGQQKINSALAFGGPALAVKTVSSITGVPISHYAEIDFDGFGEIVDALGGVDVDVPMEIDDDEAGGYVAKGEQTLSGKEALILCRSRHSYDDYGDGDLYRAANQRLVISAIAQKLLAADPVTIASSVSALSEHVITDMDVTDIIGIAQSMRGLDAEEDIYTAVLPTTSKYINGGWYEIYDSQEWLDIINRINQGLPPTENRVIDVATGTMLSNSKVDDQSDVVYVVNPNTSIRLRNGNGVDGACNDAYNKLTEMGYTNISVGNANSFDFPETLVVYKKNSRAGEAQLIVDALGYGKAMKDDGTFLFDSNYLIVIGKDHSN